MYHAPPGEAEVTPSIALSCLLATELPAPASTPVDPRATAVPRGFAVAPTFALSLDPRRRLRRGAHAGRGRPRGPGHARVVVAGSLQTARERGVTRAVLFTNSPSAVRSCAAVGFRRAGDWGLVLFR